MKFFKDLFNPELYRGLRIFRNLSKLTDVKVPEGASLKTHTQELWKTLVMAPRIDCTVISADYDCRHPIQAGFVMTAEEKEKWNIFVRLTVKIHNAGIEESRITGIKLDVRGYGKNLEAQVTQDAGRALNYSGGDLQSCLPGIEIVSSLSFIVTTDVERSKPLMTRLRIKFDNYKEVRIKKIITRLSR